MCVFQIKFIEHLNPKKTKIFISWKIFPLFYPEKSWLLLKQSKEAFCLKKTIYVLPDCLGAAWKSKKFIKTSKTAFHTDKDLKSKNVTSKKVILAKDFDTERNILIKAKKNRPENGLFFGAT